jgi:hypothetical protein
VVKIQARLQITPAGDQRGSPRRKLCLGTSLRATGEKVVIHDLSSTGMLIETAAKLAPFDSLEIELPEAGVAHALVIWSSGSYYGCEFKNRLSRGAVSASRLRSLPRASAEPPQTLQAAPVVAPPDREGTPEHVEPLADADEDRAPLGTRLLVILGSTIILWAVIIWVVVSFVRMVREWGG